MEFSFDWRLENDEQNVVIEKSSGLNVNYDFELLNANSFKFSRDLVIPDLNPVLNDHVEVFTFTRK